MKVAWAVGAAALISVPILALPSRWSGQREDEVGRYHLAGSGDRTSIACQAARTPFGRAGIEICAHPAMAPAYPRPAGRS